MATECSEAIAESCYMSVSGDGVYDDVVASWSDVIDESVQLSMSSIVSDSV